MQNQIDADNLAKENEPSTASPKERVEKESVLRKPMVYTMLFGLIFSILAWGVGECYWAQTAEYLTAVKVISYLIKNPNMTEEEFKHLRDQNPKLKDNPYLQDSFFELSDAEQQKIFKAEGSKVQAYNWAWNISLAILIAVGLAIAEPCVMGNFLQAAKYGGVAAILGTVGGLVIVFSFKHVYWALGGGHPGAEISPQQIFARAVTLGVMGLFVAVAPGICLKSWKKFLLGCVGGFLGGFFAGCFFDLIDAGFGSDVFARLVFVVGIGGGVAFATVQLENIAKQGWLKVAAGEIAGKQFILCRNPTVIGSSPKCEIYLKDPQIAPRHAAVNDHRGDFFITSIDDAPLSVNDAPERQRRLSTGDRIRIGNTVFVFEAKAIKK